MIDKKELTAIVKQWQKQFSHKCMNEEQIDKICQRSDLFIKRDGCSDTIERQGERYTTLWIRIYQSEDDVRRELHFLGVK